MTCFFFFNYPATTEIYTLSLHDALPICLRELMEYAKLHVKDQFTTVTGVGEVTFGGYIEPNIRVWVDRKSTRLNSSHLGISYAVFCLKKKKLTRTWEITYSSRRT